MDLQAMMDGMSARWQRERAASQFTLGDLIECLEAMPPETPVANLRDPGSYRGYYSDLYFERHEGTRPASELLDVCRSAMGEVFTGYKGGEYVMGARTPLWIATYGDCGQKIIALHAGGNVQTADDD